MSYLSLSICVVLSVDALQCLSIPPELVVASISVDDSGAVISCYHLLCASLCPLAHHQGG